MSIKCLIDEIHPVKGPIPNLYGSELFLNVDDEVEYFHSYFANKMTKWVYPIILDNMILLNTLMLNENKLKKALPKNVVDGALSGRGLILICINEPLRQEILDHLEFMINNTEIGQKIIMITFHTVNNPNFIRHSKYDYDHFSVLSEFAPSQKAAHFNYYYGDGSTSFENLENFDNRHYCCFMQYFYETPDKGLVLDLLEKHELLNYGFVSAKEKAKNFNSIFSSTSAVAPDYKLSFSSNNKLFDNLSLFKTFEKVDLNLVYTGDILTCNAVWVGEAINRNFALKKPFIALGQKGTLKAIKHLGYKTFSDILDEDYDDETDDLKRVQKALRSLKVYIDNKPDINKLKDVLEHNHNIWLNKKRYVTEKIHEMLDESKF